MAHISQEPDWIYNFLAQQLNIKVGEDSVVANQLEARARNFVVTSINHLDVSCSV